MSVASPKLQCMSISKPSLFGLFSGVGGIEMGFERAGFQTLLANEIDEYAATTYRKNHKHPLLVEDIRAVNKAKVAHALDVKLGSIPKIDVLAGGFPCQPFSVAGYRKGFDDDRGNVYWDIHRLIRELKPEVVFLENVKNLRGHDNGKTFETILGSLQNEIEDPSGTKVGHRYHVASAVLNAKEFGVPQNRERIFIVAFRDRKAFERFSFPALKSGNSTPSLARFIDFDSQLDSKYYYDKNRPFFDQLKAGVTESNTVYQWRRQYVRENKSGICPTLTANMGMGGHNVPIVKTKHGIRKLTPQECFGLMGMGKIKIPEGMSESRLYKQAGNAVVVPVIEAVAKRIKLALNRP
jgi:DNA (cytosine-5)-methyltransferase 1